MPELPELEVYRENLEALLRGREARAVEVRSVFTVRTVDPPFASVVGRRVAGAGRRDKRLVLSFEGGPHLEFHLMRSGRLRWKRLADRLHGKLGCLRIDFEHGSLHMTEASSRKSASLHVVREPGAPRGADPLGAGAERMRELLSRESRQLKGALVDPDLLAGIGNAYSDEILFDARLSPLKLTAKLADAEWARLHASIGRVLREWIGRVREAAKGALPTEQDEWRREMNVHGKFKSPCPSCGGRVERIAYAESETHYCPACQNGGRKLSDRRLDRLLR